MFSQHVRERESKIFSLKSQVVPSDTQVLKVRIPNCMSPIVFSPFEEPT